MSPSYNVYASVIPGYTPVTATAPAPTTASLPVATVGAIQVPVISSVMTPGTVGLYQITIQLPLNLPSGTVPIQASIGGASTQSSVTLFVGAQ